MIIGLQKLENEEKKKCEKTLRAQNPCSIDMNIFALDDCPIEAATCQHDKHVSKMILETAQMISACIWVRDDWYEDCKRIVRDPCNWLYKPAYVNHPCTVWARQTRGNMNWLLYHGRALNAEFKYRFGSPHKSFVEIINPFVVSGMFAWAVDRTPFAVAMPKKYKVEGDPVQSYRNYYLAEKIDRNTKWTKRCRVSHLPRWMSEHVIL